MGDVKTAISDPRTAIDSDNLIDMLREELEDLVNNPVLEPAFVPIEQQFNVKRKHIGYGLTALLGIYLAFGSSAQLVCNLIGCGFPMYVFVKGVSKKEAIDTTQWLVYWMLFASLSLFDFFAEVIRHVFPFYYLLKAVILLYLYSPHTNGASVVYKKYIEPTIMKLDQSSKNYKKKHAY